MDGTAGDEARKNELAHVRQLITGALQGTEGDVLALPVVWSCTQQLFSNISNSPAAKDLFMMISSSVCEGVGNALSYHFNDTLYNIPTFDPADSSPCHSWTPSLEMLDGLFTQLKFVQEFAEAVQS